MDTSTPALPNPKIEENNLNVGDAMEVNRVILSLSLGYSDCVSAASGVFKWRSRQFQEHHFKQQQQQVVQNNNS